MTVDELIEKLTFYGDGDLPVVISIEDGKGNTVISDLEIESLSTYYSGDTKNEGFVVCIWIKKETKV